MSISLPYRFMLTGILAVILGMLLGLYMGPSVDFRLMPVHAHLNLVGWATMMLYGLYYRSDAMAAGSAIARWQYWVALVGIVLMIIGLTATQLGNESLEIVLIVGSLLTLLSMLMFGWVVLQASMRKG